MTIDAIPSASQATANSAGLRAHKESGGNGRADGKLKSLSEEQVRQLTALKKRDQEVRSHEAAHLAAAGGFARGGAHFTLVRGPDGVMYAIGGDVQIDVSAVAGDPQATLRKAEMIRRAALAPASPSEQDRKVAAMADRMSQKAEMEVLQLQQAAQRKRASGYATNATPPPFPLLDQHA